MLSSIQIYVHAVGGREEMRKTRAGFVKDLGGPKNSYYKSGTTYGPAPLNPWFIPHHVHSDTPSTEGPAPQHGDVAICIGHVQDKEVKRTLAGTSLAGFFGQGPGFNYNAATKLYVDGQCSHTLHCDEGKCPSYTIDQWSKLMDCYPKPLEDMRPMQIGSFLWTRQDRFTHAKRACGFVTSAFYNQWGVNDCCDPKLAVDGLPSFWILAVERAIVNRAISQMTRRERYCGGIQDSIHRLSAEEDVKTTFSKIYAAYQKCTPKELYKVYEAYAESALHVIENLDSICYEAYRDHTNAPAADIAQAAGKIPKAGGIKEYDAFTVNCALHKMAGRPLPTHKQHYGFLLACLRTCKVRRDNPEMDFRYPPADELRDAIKCHFKGNIHVWHDLGFDPQNDDWLALQMLQAVFE